jgi:hypothetical protein
VRRKKWFDGFDDPFRYDGFELYINIDIGFLAATDCRRAATDLVKLGLKEMLDRQRFAERSCASGCQSREFRRLRRNLQFRPFEQTHRDEIRSSRLEWRSGLERLLA